MTLTSCHGDTNIFYLITFNFYLLGFVTYLNSSYIPDFQCSKSCGNGKKTRSVDCVGGLNTQCDSNNRPDTVADCNYGPCPEWKVGDWQEVAISSSYCFC